VKAHRGRFREHLENELTKYEEICPGMKREMARLRAEREKSKTRP